MDVTEVLQNLEQSTSFKNWRKSNKLDYFVHAFKLLMDGTDDEWQLGFYNREKDTITTFVTDGIKVALREDEEVFKKDKNSILEVKMDNVNVLFEKIMATAGHYQWKKYPKESSIKKIAILQNIKRYGIVWNITFITQTFNALNMKINASTGKIIEEKLAPIISFGNPA